MSCVTQLVSDVSIQTSTDPQTSTSRRKRVERAVEENEIGFRIREYDAAKINLALKWTMPSRVARETIKLK